MSWRQQKTLGFLLVLVDCFRILARVFDFCFFLVWMFLFCLVRSLCFVFLNSFFQQDGFDNRVSCVCLFLFVLSNTYNMGKVSKATSVLST